MRAIVWTAKPLAQLCSRFLPTSTFIGSAREFLDAPRDARTISFLDAAALDELDQLAAELNAKADHPPELRKLVSAVSLGPVVGVCDRSAANAIGWFRTRPFISHVVSAALLDSPSGANHLATLVAVLDGTREPKVLDFMQPAPEGRRVRLTHTRTRSERLERMLEFYRGKGVGTELLDRVRDVANLLLINAFYDAPAALGVEASRTKEVALPADLGLDLVYGHTNDVAFLRVRDPFGSLEREHVVTGLGRPTGGLAQVFASSSIVAISVITNQRTDILVELRERDRKPEPFAYHMFFKPGPKRGMWRTIDEETGDPNSPTSSISIIVE